MICVDLIVKIVRISALKSLTLFYVSDSSLGHYLVSTDTHFSGGSFFSVGLC